MKLRNLLHIMLFTSVLITLSGCTRASTGSNSTETPSFSPDSSSAASLASEDLSSEPDSKTSVPASSNVDNESAASEAEFETIVWIPDIPYEDYVPSQPEVAEEIPPEELLEKRKPEPEGYWNINLDTDNHQKVLEAFTLKLIELQLSEPINCRYAITDIKIRSINISYPSLWGEEDTDFDGQILYAVKPRYPYYVRAGGDTDGTGEYEGYILNGRKFTISQEDREDGKYWTATRR